jgi:hypothetical protein
MHSGASLTILGASVVDAEAGPRAEMNFTVWENPFVLAVGFNKLCRFWAFSGATKIAADVTASPVHVISNLFERVF